MNKLLILKKYKKFNWKFLLRWGLFGLLVGIACQKLFFTDWDIQIISSLPFYPILFVLILMPLNWFLEGVKWQMLTENESIVQACKAVLLGLLFRNFISGLGDLSGRLIGDTNKKESVFAFMLNSVTQFLVTTVFGVWAIYYLINMVQSDFLRGSVFTDFTWYHLFIVPFFIMIILLVFKKGSIRKYLNLRKYDTVSVMKVFGLSLLRYVIFSLQFYIIYKSLIPELESFSILAGIALIFLSKTIVPTINFIGDLGLREISAVLFFSQFGVSVQVVIVATLLIWVINVLIPSLLAISFIPNLKLVNH